MADDQDRKRFLTLFRDAGPGFKVQGQPAVDYNRPVMRFGLMPVYST